jgi:serine/threonine-protein kinase
MIHRDIKPANILRHKKNYKIGDFGLVSDRLVLGYGSADGYISHLAPEVFGASGSVSGITSAKSDVWALGMTLYRLLHGHDFYSDGFGLKTKDEIRNMIVGGGFSRRLPWLAHIPEPWRKFIRKAMHDDGSQRFPTAHAMSQALARLPIEPSWVCEYAFDHVKWTRNDGDRVILVERHIHSPRKHEWSAKRTGAGKRLLVVGGAPGNIVSARTANEQLENFFANSA